MDIDGADQSWAKDLFALDLEQGKKWNNFTYQTIMNFDAQHAIPVQIEMTTYFGTPHPYNSLQSVMTISTSKCLSGNVVVLKYNITSIHIWGSLQERRL